MTSEEALHAVEQALAARGVPVGVGLRTSDRTFIVCLGNGHRQHAPAVAELLTAMGCSVTVERVTGAQFVYGKLAGKLRPVPVPVSSADGCTAAEAGLRAKRCNGPCGEVKSVSEFSPNGGGRLMPACRPCDATRQKAQRLARMASR